MDNQWRGLLKAVLGLALAVLFFYMMEPFLVPMILGAILAVLCFPLYSKAIHRIPRPLAAVSITLGVVIGVLLPISLVVYSAGYKVLGLISRIKLSNAGNPSPENLLDHPWLKKLTAAVERFAPLDHDWLHDQALSAAHGVLEKVSGFLASSLAGMPSFILGFVIVMLSLYFFLVDGQSFLRFLASVSPLKPEKSRELFDTFQSSCRGVVFGLLASGGVQGVLTMIFFAITGIPDPVLMGVITMVLSMVPLFGSTPIGIGAVIYLFAKGHPGMGIVMIVGAIVIGLSDNVVRPFMMKGAIEMHPLLALVSVFGALQLFGATGIFLGPIVAAVFVAFLKMTSTELRGDPASAQPLPQNAN
jgi:predicted PurR-regulated permease PerM